MNDERANWSRREFMSRLALAGTAGLLELRPEPVAAEPPPETTRIRLVRSPAICISPSTWRRSSSGSKGPGHLAALPIAQEIARLDAERRAALIEDMTEALRGYVDRDQLTVPAGAHVVSADA